MKKDTRTAFGKMFDADLKKSSQIEQLKLELSRYSISAGLADQFKGEAKACRRALGFDPDSECVSPNDLVNAIESLKYQ